MTSFLTLSPQDLQVSSNTTTTKLTPTVSPSKVSPTSNAHGRPPRRRGNMSAAAATVASAPQAANVQGLKSKVKLSNGKRFLNNPYYAGTPIAATGGRKNKSSGSSSSAAVTPSSSKSNKRQSAFAALEIPAPASATKAAASSNKQQQQQQVQALPQAPQPVEQRFAPKEDLGRPPLFQPPVLVGVGAAAPAVFDHQQQQQQQQQPQQPVHFKTHTTLYGSPNSRTPSPPPQPLMSFQQPVQPVHNNNTAAAAVACPNCTCNNCGSYNSGMSTPIPASLQAHQQNNSSYGSDMPALSSSSSGNEATYAPVTTMMMNAAYDESSVANSSANTSFATHHTAASLGQPMSSQQTRRNSTPTMSNLFAAFSQDVTPQQSQHSFESDQQPVQPVHQQQQQQQRSHSSAEFESSSSHSYAPNTSFVVVMFKHELCTFQCSFYVVEGDMVVVQADRGEHVGRVRSVQSQPPQFHVPCRILRHASFAEIAAIDEARPREEGAATRIQQIAEELELPLHVVDTEFYSDGSKMTVFFSSKSTVDFRELQRVVFREFRRRIWLINTAEVQYRNRNCRNRK